MQWWADYLDAQLAEGRQRISAASRKHSGNPPQFSRFPLESIQLPRALRTSVVGGRLNPTLPNDHKIKGGQLIGIITGTTAKGTASSGGWLA